MKLSEVRLRGCGFTLEPAAMEANVPFNLMHSILFAINLKAGAITRKGICNEQERENEKKNPEMATEFLRDELMVNEQDIANMVEHGILSKDENEDRFQLTDKTFNILKAAAEKQNQLDSEGFKCIPCQMFC